MILAVITLTGIGVAALAADTVIHVAEYERARRQSEEDIAALTRAYIELLSPLGAQP